VSPAALTPQTSTPGATPKGCSQKTTEATTGDAGKPAEQGRVAVANRTTLDASIKTIVDKATTDMDTLVEKAKDEVSKVPAPERGKPEEKNKSDDKGKPAENPGNRPSAKPTR
jgi:hypothetical protein